MDLISYIEQIRKHYEGCWRNTAIVLRWTKGPIHELPQFLSVLLFEPTDSRNMWTYATCGMSLPTDPEPLEPHLLVSKRNDEIVELLTAIAHYHRTSFLGLGHTVNFGRSWLPGSGCTYGLISFPYLDGPALEWATADGTKVRLLWLIPITPSEVSTKRNMA